MLTSNEQVVSCCKNAPEETKLDELWRIEIMDKGKFCFSHYSYLSCRHVSLSKLLGEKFVQIGSPIVLFERTALKDINSLYFWLTG